jgi:hypothetical protein
MRRLSGKEGSLNPSKRRRRVKPVRAANIRRRSTNIRRKKMRHPTAERTALSIILRVGCSRKEIFGTAEVRLAGIKRFECASDPRIAQRLRCNW